MTKGEQPQPSIEPNEIVKRLPETTGKNGELSIPKLPASIINSFQESYEKHQDLNGGTEIAVNREPEEKKNSGNNSTFKNALVMPGILGIAAGVVNIGKKIVSGVKKRRKKRVARAAKKLVKKQASLTEAETLSQGILGNTASQGTLGKTLQELQANLFGGTGSAQSMGADQVSASGNALMLQKSDEYEDVSPKGTSVSQDVSASLSFSNPIVKYGLFAIVAYFVLKALKIIK